MEKKYKKLEAFCGCTIEKAVNMLVSKSKESGELFFIDFNGHTLYSDNVTVDSAYKEICGHSKIDFDKEREKRREELIEKEKEYKSKIPDLIEHWVKEGQKIIQEDKWESWGKCVPISLSNLYHGIELGMCLDIIKIINEKSLEEAVGVMKEQDHSGMSWELMKSMVREFSNKGEEFVSLLGC